MRWLAVVVVLAACKGNEPPLPPPTPAAPHTLQSTAPELALDLPDGKLVRTELGWSVRARHGVTIGPPPHRHEAEVTAGPQRLEHRTTPPPRCVDRPCPPPPALTTLVDDGQGGVVITISDDKHYRATGLTSGTMVILDDQGVALVRVRREGGQAIGSDSQGRLLWKAQSERGGVQLFAPDGTPDARVEGISDPAVGLALSTVSIPRSVRALLAAHVLGWPKPGPPGPPPVTE
jgi:hypothetical protein